MQIKEMLNKTLTILFVTIILLFASSAIPEGEILNGIFIKNVDILGDLKSEESQDDIEFDEYYENELEDSSNSADTLSGESALINSENFTSKAGFTGLSGLFEIASDFVNYENDKMESYYVSKSIDIKKEQISGNVTQLQNFLNALKNTKTKKVRIAHFGDSGIEGDYVTSEIRDIFQLKYGGKGIGFLPIMTEELNYRTSTEFSYSKDWEVFGINKRNPDRLPVGINGEVFINKAGSWFEYKPKTRYETMRSFDEVLLYYSDAKLLSSFNYEIDGKNKGNENLEKGKSVQETKISVKNGKSIRVEFPKAEEAYLYGLSLEGGPGVYVDNFPFRGNTGVDLINIPKEALVDFNRFFNYDLVIFQFGLNALSARNFRKYEKDMIKVIEHFKEAMPNASFILISAQDRSVKKGNKFVTDSSLEDLVQAQINIARETKIAFWNLFEAMGGRNSMENWVNANPPLAHKDYIHFNEYGVKKIAEMFSEALLELK